MEHQFVTNMKIPIKYFLTLILSQIAVDVLAQRISIVPQVNITPMHKYLQENRDLRNDIDSLNKTKNKQSLINIVNVHLVSKNQDELISEDIQKEIESDIKSELKLVIGQKATYVKDAQPLYEKLITQKTYILHDKKYIVEVKSIVLIETELTVWITAQEKRT